MRGERPVLLATNTFGRLGGEINGVAHSCQRFAACFRATGKPLEVVAYGDDDASEIDGSVTVRTQRPRLGVHIDQALQIDPLFSAGPVARAIWRRDYSLVHTTSPDPLGCHATVLAKLRGLPLVSAYHTALDEYVRIRFTAGGGRIVGRSAAALMSSILYVYYSQADLVIAPSAATRAQLERRLRVPVRILGRGVDAELFNPERRWRPEGTPRALYVGRVAREKSLHRLVPIFSGRRDVSLTVVGDGPWLETMKQRLPEARYTGALRGDALYDEYANADFFVFPSTTDTFGNVVLEAMSSGIPAIVTDRGGPAEIVRHGVDGIVTANDEELRTAVSRLAYDPETRRTMGSSARLAAEARSWPLVFARLLSLYEEAASIHAGRNQRPRTTRRMESRGLLALHARKLQSGPVR